MKRSEINALIRAAEERFEAAGLFLPEWAHWSPEDWRQNRAKVGAVVGAGLGWDLTDFGSGAFERRGLLLFTVRNGTPDPSSRLPYAEKLMLVGDGQVTPMHFHWRKTEDIINRGGGELVVELVKADCTTEKPTTESFVMYRDSLRVECEAHDKIRLQPGQSITLTPYIYHAFWAEHGSCIVGEVSSVNDDGSDNRFLENVGRFPEIEDDEPPYRLLCTDYMEVLR